jgi:hypothetical protein
VARRRYRSDAISAAGHGGETPAEAAPPEQHPLGSEPTPAQNEAKPEPSQHFSSGLGEQLRQQQQHAAQAQLHGYIDSIPSLSAAQRQWLHLNPHGVYRFDLLHGAHTIATEQRGIKPDTREYFDFLSNMLNTYGHLPPQQPAHAAPAPPPPQPEPVAQHVAHVDLEHVEHDHEPDEAHAMASFISAPVSRGDHGHAIEPEPTMGSIRLTAEQRDIAARSGISDVEYAKQLLKMQKMKTSGLIK